MGSLADNKGKLDGKIRFSIRHLSFLRRETLLRAFMKTLMRY